MYTSLGQNLDYGWVFLYGPPAKGAADQFLGWVYTSTPGAQVIAKRASGAIPGFLDFSATTGLGWQQLQEMISQKTGEFSSQLTPQFLSYYYPATPQVAQTVRTIMRGIITTSDREGWIRQVRVFDPNRNQIR